MSEIIDLLKIADRIAKDIARPESITADAKGQWVSQTIDALKESKLTGLLVPAELGGKGQGLYALARICESLGQGYSSAGLCFGMHCVATAVMASKATDYQQEHYLVPIAEGKHITTLALSEAGTGAHFYFPQTPLIAITGDEFVVDGKKIFVTNGSYADSYVVSTLGASSEAEADQFSCVILDKGMAGISWGPAWDGLGMRGNSSLAMDLDHVHLHERQILGERGDQLWYIFNVVAPYFLMAMAGTYLGIASAALEEATKALSLRSYAHNGSNLSQVSTLQHRLGMMWSNLERTRQLIYNAAHMGDSGSPDALLHLLSAKAEVAGCCVEMVNQAMTMAGGQGYHHNSHLGILLRDARAADVMSPTTDLLYTWMGRVILDQPIFTD
jgi:alkylation response protein AidB-like acyl-CoA dehydrogenase